MSRPLMQHGVGQLEEMFAKGKSDPKVLKHLELELQYRQVPRAVALLAEVQSAMYGGTPATPAVASPAHQTARAPAMAPVEPSLWERPPPALPAAIPVAIQPRPLAPAISPPVARPQSPPLPTMPLEEACKVLKTTPRAAWESIEQTRRLTAQQSHPSLLKQLNDEKRAQALNDAKRANAAYVVLQAARCGST